MKITKCDVCGRTVSEYFQVKYRRITQQTTGETKRFDLCGKCMDKAVTVFKQEKGVNNVS